ncbi:alpha/beta fold hydrolase [Microbacterium esteraromaticum]|uniref:alpha/beta fold hydrolase n=1 Tax=Microbacterium esteraromaticum TaxID=57043 RepID=UPI0019D41013|nr:alpha/beta hydrolase [Microbacterium esteraromaticum]MBN7793182.1 alpha/beta hydrolase [Microbacterium esteraromaticum]
MIAVDRTLHRPGAEVRFHDSGGRGRAVVLLHGAGMDHTIFHAQAHAAIAMGHRVVLCDLRGHGDSELGTGVRFTAADALADLMALLETLELDRPVLVGHSLGGNLAQAFVREHPQRAGGLIVVDATWNAGPLTGRERFALALAAPMLALIPASRLPRVMARASAVEPGAVEEIERIFHRMPKKRFMDVWRATASFADPDPQYRTPVPLALIRGARDSTGNIATAMPAWAAFEGVAERIVPGAGHVVTWDAPEGSTRALLSALAEVGEA